MSSSFYVKIDFFYGANTSGKPGKYLSVLTIFISFTNLILKEIPVTKQLKNFWYLFTSLRNQKNFTFYYNIIKVC